MSNAKYQELTPEQYAALPLEDKAEATRIVLTNGQIVKDRYRPLDQSVLDQRLLARGRHPSMGNEGN